MWRFDTSRWSFTACGVYAIEKMFPGCKVLDLCCGNATYSYLFFSDIAGRVDAIDNDLEAITYAKRFNNKITINYFKFDTLNEPFPNSDYDIIVWNAGI